MLSLLVVDPLDVAALVLFVLVLLFTDYRPAWWWHSPKASAIHGLKHQTRVKKVPGPPALPFIGTRWLYSVGLYKINKIHEVYQDLYKKYGPVVKEEALWNFPVISLFAAADIEKVLRYSSRYPIRPPTEVTAYYRRSRPDRYTNTGLVNEQGETWHTLRTSLTPALTSAATMQRFLPELNKVADDFNRLLTSSREPNGIVKSFEQLANRMGLESTCTLILGRRMGFLDNKIDSTALRLAHAVQVQFCASRDTFYGLPFWKMFPTAAYRKLIESEDMIYDVISELVDSALKEEQETCETDAVNSVFMSILQAPSLDTRDKKAAIIDFIAAGIKTLGNTLVFLLYLVAKNPQVQNKLYAEIVTLAPVGTPITSEALRDAPYLRACITEAFRMLPTAPCVARILETDMDLSGHRLKSGTVVLCQTWVASQQKDNFSQPGRFIPERWLTNHCSCKTSQSHPSSQNELTETSPKKTRECSPQTSQTKTRECSPQTSSEKTKESSPQTSPTKTRECSPQTSPTKTRECSPQTSTTKTRECSPQTSPTKTRECSPQTSQLPNECQCTIQKSRSKSFLVAPFGVGKRMCPGKRFVQLELQVVLAQTIRQFEILYEGELDLQFEFLLAPAAKTNFILKDRI